ncbi:T9SS type A sorting domain-containing protein [bacterium]|nr:T9SS type A sorting domain-containing protein [bacterium]
MRKVVESLIAVLLSISAVYVSMAHERSNVDKTRLKSQLATQRSLFGLSGLTKESFEGETFPPDGWRKLTNFDGTGWIRAAVDSPVIGFDGGAVDAPSGGGGFVALASWATGDADGAVGTDQATDQWLVTPQITDVQTGDSLQFYLKYFDRFGDTLDVWISTADSIPSGADTVMAAFDTLITRISFSGPNNNNWQRYAFSLTDFVESGSDIFLGFREHVAHNSAEGDALFLDLVEVASLVTSLSSAPVQPVAFRLHQNYPNPFNPTTNISFSLAERSAVTLRVYNLLGKEEITLIDGEVYPRGSHSLRFDAASLPNGTYYYRIEVGGHSQVRKMILMK